MSEVVAHLLRMFGCLDRCREYEFGIGTIVGVAKTLTNVWLPRPLLSRDSESYVWLRGWDSNH